MGRESTSLSSAIKALPAFVYIRAWKNCGTGAFQKHVFFQGVIDTPGGKKLQLRVPDSTWRQEMNLQRQKILVAFNEACEELGLERRLLPVDCVIVL